MGAVKKVGAIFFNKKAYKKMLAYSLLILLLYVFRDFLGIFFLTFIFAYLFSSIAIFIKSKLNYLWKKIWFLNIFWKTPFWFIIILEYILFIWIIVFFVANIIPSIQKEVESISKWFSIEESIVISNEWEIIITENEEEKRMKSGSEKIIDGYNNLKDKTLEILLQRDPSDNLGIRDKIINFENNLDFVAIKDSLLNWLQAIWSSVWKIALALMLSFIFIIDRKKVWTYLYKIKESNFSFMYSEYELLIDKVVKSFWLILKAQSTIALVNMLITILGFYVIWLFYGGFPYILTLAIVVFVFSFIPILWMWISAIPLTLVAYMNWWFEASILVLFMILFTTAFEAYFLNPKIVSSLLELPVSLTFIILIVSEHFFGFAGLLIWISLFYFTVWLIKDFNQVLEDKKKKKLRTFFTKKEKNIE